MAFTFTIDGYDRNDYLILSSLEVTEGSGPHGDTCSFVIEIPNALVPDTVDRPTSGNPVEITIDKNLPTEVVHFKGIVAEVTEEPFNPDVTRYSCSCTDYTRWLDRVLITTERPAELAGDRIKALVTWILNELEGAPFPFGTSHVENGYTVEAESYDYVTLSSILSSLAETCIYHWYVDFDKEIYFYEIESADNVSPLDTSYSNILDLDDSDTNLVIGDIVISEDSTQIKNRIYIKGYSEKDSNARPETHTAEADKSFYKLFQAPWDAESTTVTVDGTPRTVVIDPLDGAQVTLDGKEGLAYICTFNMGLRFPLTDLPTAGQAIAITYHSELPDRISMFEDKASIDFFADRESYGTASVNQSSGVHSFMVSVPNVKVTSIDPIEAMGEYLLARYAWPLRSGSFTTYSLTGWKSGQYFNLTSDSAHRDIYDYESYWKSGDDETKNPVVMYVHQVRKTFQVVSDGAGGTEELVREEVEFSNQPYLS